MGLKAPRGMGMLTNPKKALYNKVYRKTTFGIEDVLKSGKRTASKATYSSAPVSLNSMPKPPMGASQKKILWIGIIGTIVLIFTGVGVVLAPFFLIGVVYYWNKTPEVRMKKALTMSNFLYKKGQIQESVDVLLPFKDSKNYEVYSRLGYRYGQLGNYQEAETYSQYCYDQNPNDLENLYVHSITLFNLKKYKESQEALSILPASAQTEPIFANIIGANYSGMGKEDIAIEIYKKCLGRKQNIDGEEISIAINLAKILIEKKKKLDAKKFLLRILAVNPMHGEATELLDKTEKAE